MPRLASIVVTLDDKVGFSDIAGCRSWAASGSLEKAYSLPGRAGIKYLAARIALDYLRDGSRSRFFSLSYSEGAVAAATSDLKLGIDIESDEPLTDSLRRRAFPEMPPTLSVPHRACVLMWTRKEATMKALDRPLHQLPSTRVDELWTGEIDAGSRHVGAVAAIESPTVLSHQLMGIEALLGKL